MPLSHALPETASPLATLEADELARQIAGAMALLTQSQQSAVELRELGLSTQQIASIAGCTEKAARRRLEAAKAKLAAALGLPR